MGRRLYIVPGTSGLAVPAANATGPGVAADVTLVLPRARHVGGVLVIPRSNAGGALTMEAIAASLSIGITDENQEQLISDGQGSQLPSSTGALVLTAAPCLMLTGRAWRPFPLQRLLRGLEKWVFSVQNRDTNITTLAGIFLYTEDPS